MMIVKESARRPKRGLLALGTPVLILVILVGGGVIQSNQLILSTFLESMAPALAAERDSSLGLQQLHVKESATNIARFFPKKSLELFCTHDENSFKNYGGGKRDVNAPFVYNHPTGLLYVKCPKTGSSTLAGVVDRIVWNNGMCDYRDNHIKRGTHRYYGNRIVEQSFLLGSVRNPAARAISRVSFEQYSQHSGDPTDENVLNWLNDTRLQFGSVSPGQGGFQLNYLTIDQIDEWSSFQWDTPEGGSIPDPAKVEQDVKRVIEKYDFIAVAERMDESLVAMAMIMDVPVTDVLVVDSKHSGDYYFTGTYGCIKTSKIPISHRVKAYLQSDVWYALNYGDYLLLAAANESLNRTIEALGRDQFDEKFQEYMRLKTMMNDECSSQAFYACSPDGQEQHEVMNCYTSDHGCGYPCVDKMVERIKKEANNAVAV